MWYSAGIMNKEFKNLLADYVALKSISTDPAYATEMKKTAEWLGAYLENHGFKVSYLKGPRTNPVVFAEYIQSKNKIGRASCRERV